MSRWILLELPSFLIMKVATFCHDCRCRSVGWHTLEDLVGLVRGAGVWIQEEVRLLGISRPKLENLCGGQVHTTWAGSGSSRHTFIFPTHSFSVAVEEIELRAVDNRNWCRNRVEVSSRSSSATGRVTSRISSASGVEAVQSTAPVGVESLEKYHGLDRSVDGFGKSVFDGSPKDPSRGSTRYNP
jgi:hypothetical protein